MTDETPKTGPLIKVVIHGTGTVTPPPPPSPDKEPLDGEQPEV